MIRMKLLTEMAAALQHAAKASSSWTLKADRRAVVGCILRHSKASASSTSPAPGRIADEIAGLEVLFILRASDPNGSQWSGQVAFPGGHAEEGETDLMVSATGISLS